MGKHPRVCQLMSGIFVENPTRPRYTFVWDVEQVLRYLDGLPENEHLTDRLLTLKLTTLIALTAAGRSSEIRFLDIRFMAKTDNSIIFWLNGLSKTRKKGQSPQKIELHKFEVNQKLCVFRTIECYLTRSKSWRNDGKNQLLLSPLKPHREVVKSTIANWILVVLKSSGIDTDTFRAHSCRSASTSKAKATGLSLQQILDRGSWTGSSVWQKHYHKPIINSAKEYQESVLSLKKSL